MLPYHHKLSAQTAVTANSTIGPIRISRNPRVRLAIAWSAPTGNSRPAAKRQRFWVSLTSEDEEVVDLERPQRPESRCAARRSALRIAGSAGRALSLQVPEGVFDFLPGIGGNRHERQARRAAVISVQIHGMFQTGHAVQIGHED
jgi:hypothetical protein